MSEAEQVGIRAWRPATGVEPLVRVGVILDRDAAERVRLRVPGSDYRLECAGHDAILAGPGTSLSATLADRRVAVDKGDGSPVLTETARLSPTASKPLGPGAGLVVHDVIAGRGFHWQKRIDQTLSGVVELRPGRRGVILVNELPLEEYLAGVITAEMSGACPSALLAAQCIVARSWLLAMSEPKHDDEPYDRCNDDCCQRYQGTGDLSSTAIEAARATRGMVLLAPTGDVLDANYSKSCGGISELPEHVWGAAKPGISAVVDAPPRPLEHRFLPITESNLDDYLDGRWLGFTRIYCSPKVVSPDAIGRYLGRVDEVDDYFRWTVRYEREELEALLREKLTECRELSMLRGMRAMARGVSGRISKLGVKWENRAGDTTWTTVASEYRIRAVLHRKFLYSSAFAIRPERELQRHRFDGQLLAITLRGAGWGHGVGMCQIGALGMALSGIGHLEICRHYYPQARLATVYK